MAENENEKQETAASDVTETVTAPAAQKPTKPEQPAKKKKSVKQDLLEKLNMGRLLG